MDKANVLLINSQEGLLNHLSFTIQEQLDSFNVYHKADISYSVIKLNCFEHSILKQQNLFYKLKKHEISNGPIYAIWLCINGKTQNEIINEVNAYKSFIGLFTNIPVVLILNQDINFKIHPSSFNGLHIKKIIEAKDIISKLLKSTNQLLPFSIRYHLPNTEKLTLKQKRKLAQGMILSCTGSAVVIGAIPIPIHDAFILTPLEVTLINSLAKLYGIKKSEKSIAFINTIVEIGTVSLVAKSAINALKAIPGLNIATSLMNAIIAGSFVFAIGQASDYAFSEIHKGNKSLDDIDWLKKVVESKISKSILKNGEKLLRKISNSKTDDLKAITKMIIDSFKNKDE